MNKQFYLGKIVIHDKDGGSLRYTIDDVLDYLNHKSIQTKDVGSYFGFQKPSEKPRSSSPVGYTNDEVGIDPNTYDDPLDRIIGLSEGLGVYGDHGSIKSEFDNSDPKPKAYANINVSIEGDKWNANGLLEILEATIADTIREYKEFNTDACTLKTQTTTSMSSTQ